MNKNKINLALLIGGPSAEHDVSLKTGKVILDALDKNKYDITPVTITKEGKWMLPKEGESLEILEAGRAIDILKFEREIDVVFIAMHGSIGEDGRIQGFLDVIGLPYTGSGVLASALAMDKLKSNEAYSFHDLKVPKFKGFSKKQLLNDKQKVIADIIDIILLPCVIKPSNCGSSVGITIVRKIDDLEGALLSAFSYDDIVIAQEYISGVEVTCAVLDEGGEIEPIALPPTEIVPKGSEFFDYNAKYTVGASEEITPPRLPIETINRIQDIALRAHGVLGCSGMSRTDMIVSKDDVYILETNTIPGMTETSLYPQAALAVGISFPELLDKIIKSALNKKQI